MTRLTLFTATLIQDSALSVSGLDRETSSDMPFAMVNAQPVLTGRGLKGAAVAMAKRFFDPLPRAISDNIKHGALRRSAWEFSDATTQGKPCLRAGVGIRQKTGARAEGVLYDREVMPVGTRWEISFRADRSYALDDDEFKEAEGILGYVLTEHWAKERCWLGGGVARGLGWCHIEDLKVYRLNEAAYENWITNNRDNKGLPSALNEVPVVEPTRSWYFRTLDVNISFGAYKPDSNESAWGLDMFSVGPHNTQKTMQPTGSGIWAKPTWAADADTPDLLHTDHALLMDGPTGKERPLLPGSSVRGPLRHALSRIYRKKDQQDPHLTQGEVNEEDRAGKVFGTVNQSSRLLIRDALANEGWAAAKLHMHAEDEFSASTYGSSKRDAVRLLQGNFPVRIVVEGGDKNEVESIQKEIDRLIELGAIGHLGLGGHKTRGAGWGRWTADKWVDDKVIKAKDPLQPVKNQKEVKPSSTSTQKDFLKATEPSAGWIKAITRKLTISCGNQLTLGEATKQAKEELGINLIAWWCEPATDLTLTSAPSVFGKEWPDETDSLKIDEIAFYAKDAVWRAAQTSKTAAQTILITETSEATDGAKYVQIVSTPARLHGFSQGEHRRFTAASVEQNDVILREWFHENESVGFTITRITKE